MPRVFNREILRKRITETRESQGMNQAELAEKAGVTPAAISQIEKGTRVPTIPVLHRIANVLGVSLDYLTGKTDRSELEDLLQHDDFVAFFRGFESLGSEDKEIIKKHIDFLKFQYERRKRSDTAS
ncbi:MAG: helix-turn-helix transcriptional regulator [Deltaproteobacteria bacterium]|nr:helix-turn-helix transcriptional regulator [Deltaproteobacteria bacterium]